MDYYSILGVEKDSSFSEIKKAYRTLAKKLHPDVTGNDSEAEEKFKQVSEAYSVLSDEEKRSQYDMQQAGGMFSGFPFDFGNFDPFGVANNARPRNPPQQVPRRGSDVRVRKSISLYDAIAGITVSGVARFNAHCAECGGLGGFDFSERCGLCNGTGMQQIQRGIMSLRIPCQACSGSGFMYKQECSTCSGTKINSYEKEYEVRIEPGFYGGDLVMSGLGAPGVLGGDDGNLVLSVSVSFPSVDINSLSEEEKEVLKKYLK